MKLPYKHEARGTLVTVNRQITEEGIEISIQVQRSESGVEFEKSKTFSPESDGPTRLQVLEVFHSMDKLLSKAYRHNLGHYQYFVAPAVDGAYKYFDELKK